MTKRLTWGYRPGKARLFELAPGETLPKGWTDTIPRGEHPHDIERGVSGQPEAPKPGED